MPLPTTSPAIDHKRLVSSSTSTCLARTRTRSGEPRSLNYRAASGIRTSAGYHVWRSSKAEIGCLTTCPASAQHEHSASLTDLVATLTRPIPMIGELTVYDATLRVGARFGHAAEKV